MNINYQFFSHPLVWIGSVLAIISSLIVYKLVHRFVLTPFKSGLSTKLEQRFGSQAFKFGWKNLARMMVRACIIFVFLGFIVQNLLAAWWTLFGVTFASLILKVFKLNDREKQLSGELVSTDGDRSGGIILAIPLIVIACMYPAFAWAESRFINSQIGETFLMPEYISRIEGSCSENLGLMDQGVVYAVIVNGKLKKLPRISCGKTARKLELYSDKIQRKVPRKRNFIIEKQGDQILFDP